MPEQHSNEARSAIISKERSFPLPDGTSIELGQIGLVDYRKIEDEALSEYKRNFIKTYTENADLMPEELRKGLIADAMKEARNLSVKDLGEKQMNIPILKDGEVQFKEGAMQTMVRTVPYSAWWMSETISGRVMAIWLSMRAVKSQCDMTHERASEILTLAMQAAGESIIEEAAQVVGELAESKLAEAVGN